MALRKLIPDVSLDRGPPGRGGNDARKRVQATWSLDLRSCSRAAHFRSMDVSFDSQRSGKGTALTHVAEMGGVLETVE